MSLVCMMLDKHFHLLTFVTLVSYSVNFFYSSSTKGFTKPSALTLKLKISAFCSVMPYSLVDVYQNFEQA
jgi:hypothetical protein